MAKLTAWLVTIIGVLLILNQVSSIASAIQMDVWFDWAIALGVLVIGVGKLIRNYKR